ncbi:hypothetical protein OM416_20490 [Paenibacillus sp. LS1]|uniref:hypothetical protein n=1 Tax=Paenibacillus sp. LS1 TaxID=2992120 RepID=UPI00223017F3|nr:hypothetical protein [Paenibacillus sp. LS1]MCW3793977.1 hypothetical protein [Paenibacillus sp. LS1]
MADVTLFDLDILDCKDVDYSEESVMYNAVTFHLESLKMFDGNSVEISEDWQIKIWSEDGQQILKQFFLIENQEFKRKLYQAYPL